MSEYTVEYFIAKFEAIAEEKWTRLEFKDQYGRCCALGHCGCDCDTLNPAKDDLALTPEAQGLCALLGVDWGHVGMLNDGRATYQHLKEAAREETPRARILAALHSLKQKSNNQMEGVAK